MWDPALVIHGLVVSTPPKEEWHTVTFMTAAMHHTQCVVHAAGINALHVLHSMRVCGLPELCPTALILWMVLWTNTRLVHTMALPINGYRDMMILLVSW